MNRRVIDGIVISTLPRIYDRLEYLHTTDGQGLMSAVEGDVEVSSRNAIAAVEFIPRRVRRR
jgi:hypothetical protein